MDIIDASESGGQESLQASFGQLELAGMPTNPEPDSSPLGGININSGTLQPVNTRSTVYFRDNGFGRGGQNPCRSMRGRGATRAHVQNNQPGWIQNPPFLRPTRPTGPGPIRARGRLGFPVFRNEISSRGHDYWLHDDRSGPEPSAPSTRGGGGGAMAYGHNAYVPPNVRFPSGESRGAVHRGSILCPRPADPEAARRSFDDWMPGVPDSGIRITIRPSIFYKKLLIMDEYFRSRRTEPRGEPDDEDEDEEELGKLISSITEPRLAEFDFVDRGPAPTHADPHFQSVQGQRRGAARLRRTQAFLN